MTLADVYGVAMRMRVGERVRLSHVDWMSVREEVAGHPLSQKRGVLCADIDEPNFLVGGTPICVARGE
jgi:hypothetical protein